MSNNFMKNKIVTDLIIIVPMELTVYQMLELIMIFLKINIILFDLPMELNICQC